MGERKGKLTVVSLFAGAGGLDIAVCSTGLVGWLLSTDSNPLFLQTVVGNLPAHFHEVEHRHLVADARGLTGDEIRQALGAAEVDLVMGGPPCDDFTSYGRKKGPSGDKAPLVFEYARLVSELRPRAFLFENVPNLARQFNGFWARLLDAFPRDYQPLAWRVLAAKSYGAPTLRERLFAVGLKNPAHRAAFRFPPPTHGDPPRQATLFGGENALKPYVTVGDVLQGLPDVTDPRASLFPNHEGRRHRPQTVEHLKTVPQGVEVGKSYRYRASWRGLCRSLTAGLDDSAKAYIHPLCHREMSVREYARIHGFPDSWVFAGRLDSGLKQIANAVPIPLGRAVVRSVLGTLTGGGV